MTYSDAHTVGRDPRPEGWDATFRQVSAELAGTPDHELNRMVPQKLGGYRVYLQEWRRNGLTKSIRTSLAVAITKERLQESRPYVRRTIPIGDAQRQLPVADRV